MQIFGVKNFLSVGGLKNDFFVSLSHLHFYAIFLSGCTAFVAAHAPAIALDHFLWKNRNLRELWAEPFYQIKLLEKK